MNMHFNCGQVCSGVTDLYRVVVCLGLWGLMLQTVHTYVNFLSFGISWWNIKSMVLATSCYFHPCERHPSLLHMDVSYTGVYFLVRYRYPNTFTVVSQRM